MRLVLGGAVIAGMLLLLGGCTEGSDSGSPPMTAPPGSTPAPPGMATSPPPPGGESAPPPPAPGQAPAPVAAAPTPESPGPLQPAAAPPMPGQEPGPGAAVLPPGTPGLEQAPGAVPPGTPMPGQEGVAPGGPAGQPAAEAPLPDTPEGRSMKNLRTIALAMHQFHERQKTLPPVAKYNAQGEPLLSWRVLLLPYIGQESLYKEFHLDEPWDSAHNQSLASRMPDVYKTPEGPEGDKTCYLAPVGTRTIFSQHEGMALNSIRDGVGNTLLIVEADPDRAVVWTRPEDLQIIPAQPSLGLGALRGGRFLAVCADGTPHRFSTTSEAATLRALFTPTGGEKLSAAAFQEKPGEKPGEAASPAKPSLGLLEQGRRALAQGYGRQGMGYLMAAAVVKPDEDVLGQLRWSPGLRRPVLATRWGLAVSTGSKSSEAKPNEPAQPLIPDQAAGMNVGGGGDKSWQALLGQPIVERLHERITDGTFGTWLSDLDEAAEEPKEQKQVAPELAPGGAAPPMPGMVAAPGIPMPGAPGGPQGAAGGLGSAKERSQRLGLVLLGTADLSRARQMAAKEGLDLILLAECSTKPGRGRAPSQSIVVLRIFDVAGSKELWGSRSLSDVRVQAAREGKDKERSDPVGDVLDSLTKYIDERLKLEDMPPISAEAARNRAEALSSRPSNDPLPQLMELRYYEWKKLLTPDELSASYSKLIGPQDGPRLAVGSEQERQSIIERWLPKL